MRVPSLVHRLAVIACVVIGAQTMTHPVAAQTQGERAKPTQPNPRKPAPPPPKSRGLRVRVNGNVGLTAFAASDSFKAVLGTSKGVTYGGGAGVLIGPKLFINVDVDRFTHSGERVFIGANKERFGLGIPVDITTLPIDATIGWRARMTGDDDMFGRQQPRKFIVTSYVGAGAGVLKYDETSKFAEAGEDVSKTFTSYHILGGAEFPVAGAFGIHADVLYRWVPNALGDAGVSKAFNEKDLGGFSVRIKAAFTF